MAEPNVIQQTKLFSFTTMIIVGILSGILIWLLLPVDIEPIVHQISPELAFPSDAISNNRLSNMEKISIEPYHGGESLVSWNGSIYTSVREGKILRIDDSGVQVFSVISPPGCETPQECGRPLGMRLLPDQAKLLVADSYLGLLTVSLLDREVRKVFPPPDSTLKPVFFDDFDLLPNNNSVILSEASTRYTIDQLMASILETKPDGRLLLINLDTGEWRTILDNMYFANGVQLHSDEKSVLVAETTKYRVLRVPLDGGPVEIFAEGLPGMPDNIRASPRGGYWVPVSFLRNTWLGQLTVFNTQWPSIRKLIYKLTTHLGKRVELGSQSAMLLRLNDTGHVVEVWRDPAGHVLNAVEVCETADRLYISSYFLPYIGRISL